MISSEPTVEEWILRGFVWTRITRHGMYRWYKEQTTNKAILPIDQDIFDQVFNKMIEDNLIIDIGDVTCYEHERHIREVGYEFTKAGELQETENRETVTF